MEKRIPNLMVINEHFLNAHSFWSAPQQDLTLAYKEAFEDDHPANSRTPYCTPVTLILASRGVNASGGPRAALWGGRVLGRATPASNPSLILWGARASLHLFTSIYQTQVGKAQTTLGRRGILFDIWGGGDHVTWTTATSLLSCQEKRSWADLLLHVGVP